MATFINHDVILDAIWCADPSLMSLYLNALTGQHSLSTLGARNGLYRRDIMYKTYT